MTDVPTHVWLDPVYVDSKSHALACNLATADKDRALPTDVEYVTRAEADRMVAAEREACAELFHSEQITIWASEILGDLSLDDLVNISDYGAKVSAYDIVSRHLQLIAAAIRSRGDGK